MTMQIPCSLHALHVNCDQQMHGWRKCSGRAEDVDRKLGEAALGVPGLLLHHAHAVQGVLLSEALVDDAQLWDLTLGEPSDGARLPAPFSPSSSHMFCSCDTMVSLRHWKCRDMAFCASALYRVIAPNPITELKKFTAICIWIMHIKPIKQKLLLPSIR